VPIRLSISKDVAFKLWKAETNNALERTAFEVASVKSRPVTMAEFPGGVNLQGLSEPNEEVLEEIGFCPPENEPHHRRQTSSLSVYPEGVESARSSMQTLLEMVDTQLAKTAPSSVRSRNSKASYDLYANKENANIQTRKQSSIKYIPADQSSITSNESNYLSYELRPHPHDVPESVTKLRPLSLLSGQGRNTHSSTSTDSVVNSPTAPLFSGKRQPQPSKLRPLQLARSATSKARGVLRRTEVLPQVVVRPPSTAENDIYVSPIP
jgi:hypothetical protein